MHNKSPWLLSGAFAVLWGLSAQAASSFPERLDTREGIAKLKALNLTHDIDTSLEAVLEYSALQGACERHFRRLDPATDELPPASLENADHLQDLLLCGKWIFFFADFESKVAFPTNIIRALENILGNETGDSFEALGFIPNPYAPGFPIGMTKAQGNPWGILGAFTGAPRTITCAACHFGQTPDGRYAAGMPNQDLRFGRFNALVVFGAWLADDDKYDPARWPVEIQNYYQGLWTRVRWSLSPWRYIFDSSLLVSWVRASDVFYRVVGLSVPTYGELETYLLDEPNRYYASSPILPLQRPNGDGAMVMSSPGIFELTHFHGDVAAGKAAPLASFIPTDTLEDFIRAAYVFQTGQKSYSTKKYVQPLATYLRTLETPKNPNPTDPQLTAEGARIFEASCQQCHDSVRGRSLQPVAIAETGTPRILLDPFVDYQPPHRLSEETYGNYLDVLGPIAPRGGIHARALKGAWLRTQLFINGGAQDVADALCLTGERGSAATGPFSDAVHLDLCTDYTLAERQALHEFLIAWD